MSVCDLQQKLKEEAVEHLLALNVAFSALDKVVKGLDDLVDSLQPRASSVKEQLSQAFKADFAIKAKAFYGAG